MEPTRTGRMTRRDFLTTAGAGLAAGWASPSLLAEGTPARKRLNVLFIVVDDLRPQLGCYGHKRMRSPGIDRLAARGLVFTRAYCQQAVCAPSRASLLTGCRPDTTRIHDLQTPLATVSPGLVTLPQHFKNHGYATVSLGKIYHHAKRDDPTGWSESPWQPGGAFPGYVLQENDWRQKRRGPPTEAADVPDERYADGRLASRAIEELGRLKGQPFFLAVGFYKPHLAFACPKRYWDLYRPDEIDLADNPFRPKNAPDIALHNWGELRSYAGVPPKGPLSDEQARRLVHGYYACVSFIDAQVGRLLDALDHLELADSTAIVLWGDHGWNLGEHGLWCKHSNFETSVHSPLILSLPAMKNAGRTSDRLTEFVDVYPSLAEACGLGVPEHVEGTSLLPLLEDPKRSWKRAAFSQYPRGKIMGYSMRTERYRFTRWQARDGSAVAVELYDHETDPQENVNVAGRAENARLVGELAAQLKAGWRAARPT